jgi:hypothetical protein
MEISSAGSFRFDALLPTLALEIQSRRPLASIFEPPE